MSVTSPISIRRTLGDGDGDGDADAIVALHDRVYRAEYDLNDEFVASVMGNVAAARAGGWPGNGGAVWLVEHDGEVAGSLGLTAEGGGVGCVRWFVFAPEVRGHGLGCALVDELLAHARAAWFKRLELETFSALTTAARIYRGAGFLVTSASEREDWGPTITYQHYELKLR